MEERLEGLEDIKERQGPLGICFVVRIALFVRVMSPSRRGGTASSDTSVNHVIESC